LDITNYRIEGLYLWRAARELSTCAAGAAKEPCDTKQMDGLSRGFAPESQKEEMGNRVRTHG